MPPEKDVEKGWVRWIHPRLSADYSAQQTEMLNLQHHTMRLEQHEQINTHDPSRFNFFAYYALEERLASTRKFRKMTNVHPSHSGRHI